MAKEIAFGTIRPQSGSNDERALPFILAPFAFIDKRADAFETHFLKKLLTTSNARYVDSSTGSFMLDSALCSGSDGTASVASVSLDASSNSNR